MSTYLYFFFGTLMDLDVLALVLERPVQQAELEPAHMDGYARVYAKNEWYPVLVPDADGAVDGFLMEIEQKDVDRIAHFEDDDYTVDPLMVTGKRRGQVEALVHLHSKGEMPTDKPWDIDTWRRRHKVRFLEMSQAWMDGSDYWPGVGED